MKGRHRCIAALGAAGVLYAAAVHQSAGGAPKEPAAFVRELVRPLLLPRLWRELGRAEARGDPAEILETARLLTRFLPDWVDGHVHFAWMLAFEESRESDTPERALACLLAAVQWLEERQNALAARSPELAAELLWAEATLVEYRCMEDPEIGAALRERVGRDATEIADDAWRRAYALAPSDVKRDAGAHLAFRMIAGALRMDDLERAARYVELARQRLEQAVDRGAAAPALAALDRLRPFGEYLAAPDEALIDALSEDPLLAEVAHALRELRR